MRITVIFAKDSRGSSLYQFTDFKGQTEESMSDFEVLNVMVKMLCYKNVDFFSSEAFKENTCRCGTVITPKLAAFCLSSSRLTSRSNKVHQEQTFCQNLQQ